MKIFYNLGVREIKMRQLIICCLVYFFTCLSSGPEFMPWLSTVKILKFGTPQTIAIIVLKIEKFDVTLH